MVGATAGGSLFLKAFLLNKRMSSSYSAGIQMLLLGPKNSSSKVVGTPGSDVIAECTSLGGSLFSLSFDDPVPVDGICSALNSLANLGLVCFCCFGVSFSSSSLSSSSLLLSSTSPLSLSSLLSSS
jgi:hypothetical protein